MVQCIALNKSNETISFISESGVFIEVEFVEEKVSGKIPWRKRGIAAVLGELREGDALIVSELSRFGRSMLECMEILSIASAAGIRVYAIKGAWRLDETIQSRIIAMAFSMAAEIERHLISARTTEAHGARRAAARAPERTGKEQARSISRGNRNPARKRVNAEVHRQALQHDLGP